MTLFEILFSYEGRIGRGSYWLGMIVVLAFHFLIRAWLWFEPTNVVLGITTFFEVVLLWPVFAIYTKRLHDHGMSGWWCCLVVLSLAIPIVNIFTGLWVLIMFGFVAGASGPNEFGQDPRRRSRVIYA